VPPGCLLGASWVPPGCLLGAFCVPPGRLLGATARIPQQGFHNKDSTARIPQQGFHSKDSTARIPKDSTCTAEIPQQGFHSRDSTAGIPPGCLKIAIWGLVQGSSVRDWPSQAFWPDWFQSGHDCQIGPGWEVQSGVISAARLGGNLALGSPIWVSGQSGLRLVLVVLQEYT